MKAFYKGLYLSLFLFVIFLNTNFSQYYYNKAASFNGTSSHIAIPNEAELNPTSAITLEAWFFPKSLSGYPTIVGKNYNTNYWFGINNAGKLRFYPKGGVNQYVDGNASILLNQWQHVVATYDGTTTKLYINGQLDMTSTTYSGVIIPNTDSLFIGADVTGYYFNGYIDNVRIWKVARTAAQIQSSMYTTLQMKIPTGNYTGLVATYNLDFGDADDWSGAVKNTGFPRNVTYVDLNGKPVNYVDYNSALVLDGNSYCAVENLSDFNAITAITLEAWIKRNLSVPQPDAQFIVGKSGIPTHADYVLFLQTAGSNLYFQMNNPSLPGTNTVSISAASNITDDAWHHVAASYNSANGEGCLYVDGNRLVQTTITGTPLIPNSADSLFIGYAYGYASASQKFKGQIDEVRVWKDVVRTQDQIKAEMYSTRGSGTSAAGGFTYAFNDFTNWAKTSNNGLSGLPLNFRGNAYLSSSHLQNDYTAPLLTTTLLNLLSGFTTSTNRTTVPAGGTASDSLTITTAGTVNSLQAFVLLNHGAVGKVSMSLISPTGVTINLLPAQNAALTDHDIMTIFDPAADSTISFTNGLKAPFSPKVKPFGNFTSFNGSIATGKWKLRITDATTGTMLRVLNGWGLKLGITVGVNDNELPTKFELNQNYPNPFNPTTTISYSLSKTAFVTLKIFDVLGREVTTLVSENKLPGKYNIKFDGTKLSSGVYLYKMTAGNFVETKKLVLIK